MLDRNIPFYNMILRCDRYHDSPICLPPGFSFRFFQPGDEKAWAALEYEIGDFDSQEEAEQYFIAAYCGDEKELQKAVPLCGHAAREYCRLVYCVAG